MKTVKKESYLFPLNSKPSDSDVSKFNLTESVDYDDPNFGEQMIVSK